MTKRAGVQSSLAGQRRRVDDKFCDPVFGMRGMIVHVIRRRSMTSFTIDTVDDLPFLDKGLISLIKARVGAMAFEAVGIDLPVEPDRIGKIAGAVAPAICSRGIRDRELE